jgi:hypothetical protein
MNAATELAFAKDRVNKAMLFDEAEAGKVAGHNTGVEVNVVIAGHVGLGAGNPSLDSLFHFGSSWH